MAKRRRTPVSGPCPCDSGVDLDGCCGPILAGATAATAEQLMRSRYTAHVVGDVEHLRRTWHPDHRPHDPVVDPTTRWRGLTVLATEGGRELDASGIVEFEARHADGVLRERSRFTRLAGAWVYVDGVPV